MSISTRIQESIRQSATTTRARILVDDLLDFVFYPECICCGSRLSRGYDYYCETCLDLASEVEEPLCPECRSEIVNLRAGCKSCENKSPISVLFTCGTFDDFFRSVVHGLKYHSLLPLAGRMSKMLASRLRDAKAIGLIDLIAPIPLHWIRQRQRGFNQSFVIAQSLADETSLPVADDLIKRVKRTKDQTGLTARQRVENMKGAFSVTRPDVVAGKRILLIDDVTTTGATLNEAALELRRAGCRNVFAAVIAVALPASSVVERVSDDRQEGMLSIDQRNYR